MEDGRGEFSLLWEKDTFLMEEFVHKGLWGAWLEQLNLCWLYLQVLTLAEISTGCGRFISLAVWKGTKDNECESQCDWPNQGKPGTDD